MKKLILFAALASSLNVAFAQAPGFAWAKQTGGISNSNISDGAGIAVDTVNHFVYVAGRYGGANINFGAGELSNEEGVTEIFFAKYNLSGGLVWAKVFTAGYDNHATGLAVDQDGNVYMSGYSESDTVRFGTHYLYNSHSGSTDHTVAFAAKFDSNGNNIWLKGSTGGGGVVCDGIAVDAGGNAYITGHVFDITSTMVGNVTVYGFFAMKLDTNGNSVWFDQATGPGAPLESHGVAIAIDHAGNCVVAGAHAAAISFGAYPVPYASGNGTTDRFVVKINGITGAYMWAMAAGVWEGPDFNHSISVDGANNIFLSGTLSVDYEGSGSSAVYSAAFVEKLNPSGASQWISPMPSNFGGGWPYVVADDAGNVYAALSISDTATFGAYTIEPNLQFGANTSEENVVVKLNAAGTVMYAKASTIPSGSFSITTPQALTRDEDNNIYFQGYLEGKNDFDMTSLDGGTGLEFFIAKLGSTVSGIYEYGKDAAMYLIYPNPAGNSVYIDKITEKTTVGIFDVTGKQVMSSEVVSSGRSIDVSQLQNGIYFIELATPLSHVTEKLIIAK